MNYSPLDNFYKIFKTIQSDNGITTFGISKKTGINVRTVQRHVNKLVTEEMVEIKSRKPAGYIYCPNTSSESLAKD